MACFAPPGALSSTDDFYQISTKLVVMETTNDVFNMSLYDLIVPQSVLSWPRVVVANTLTRSGVDWAGMFPWYNSGTYNNMWIVVDYNKFQAGKPLLDNALTITEQLPGGLLLLLSRAADPSPFPPEYRDGSVE